MSVDFNHGAHPRAGDGKFAKKPLAKGGLVNLVDIDDVGQKELARLHRAEEIASELGAMRDGATIMIGEWTVRLDADDEYGINRFAMVTKGQFTCTRPNERFGGDFDICHFDNLNQWNDDVDRLAMTTLNEHHEYPPPMELEYGNEAPYIGNVDPELELKSIDVPGYQPPRCACGESDVYDGYAECEVPGHEA